jgi:molybdopterin-guanine dinucleotide biosynthesis protein A
MTHPGEALPPYAAIILAGGAATRMGGRHKPSLPVAGIPILDRVLAAVRDATHRIVVGPDQTVPDDVLLTREDPPGGGPAAALAAGLTLLGSHSSHGEVHPRRSGFVAVLAGDQALLSGAAVRALRGAAAGAPDGVGGAVFVDGEGREQWLCGVWRVGALRDRVAEAGGAVGSGLAGAAVRRVLGGGGAVPVRWTGMGLPPWFDCDTEEQVAVAERWLGGWLGGAGTIIGEGERREGWA